jgi:hypothetical protein
MKRHLAEKNFHCKARHWLPISSLLTCFAYLSPFSSYSQKNDFIAAEPPPSGENIFIRKSDPDFLLVVCWHVLPKCYRFRVIRVSSIRLLQRRPQRKKIILFESSTPTSYKCSVNTLCLSRIIFELFKIFNSLFTRDTWLGFYMTSQTGNDVTIWFRNLVSA